MWVIVLYQGHWENDGCGFTLDGIEEVIGPFASEDLADKYAAKHFRCEYYSVCPINKEK